MSQDDNDGEEKLVLVLLSSPKSGTKARASSVLQRNIKLYGPMNALDPTDSSSNWTSEGNNHNSNSNNNNSNNKIQSFQINFGRPVKPVELRIQFQGGFVAHSCRVQALLSASSKQTDHDTKREDQWIDWNTVEWQDSSEMQTNVLLMQLPASSSSPNVNDNGGVSTSFPSSSSTMIVTGLKLSWDDCTDFYERITIYHLQVWGAEVKELY
jgi:hypothetical protein